jgi:hypothetical protein
MRIIRGTGLFQPPQLEYHRSSEVESIPGAATHRHAQDCMRRVRGTASFPAAERPRPLDGSRADEQGPQEAPMKTKIILCGQKPTFNANKVREKKTTQNQAKSFYLILYKSRWVPYHNTFWFKQFCIVFHLV